MAICGLHLKLIVACLLISDLGTLSQGSQGFNDRFMTTKQKLSSIFYQNSIDIGDIEMELVELWSNAIDGRNRVIRTENHTLVVTGSKVISLEAETLNVVATLPYLLSYEVQLVKAIEWNDQLFLLVCFKNNQCQLYVARYNFDLKYRQPLSDAGIPIDALFFVQSNKLLLAIIFQAQNCTISLTRIYRWNRTSFDHESNSDMISTASSLTVFTHKDNVILVLGCSARNNIKFPTQVWKRRAEGELTRVQYLPTSKPLSFTHFVEGAENFLMVQDADLKSIVYWWEGSEFVKWMDVSGLAKQYQISVSANIKHTSFLVFTEGNSLSIFVMTATELKKVFDFSLLRENPVLVNSIISARMFEESGSTYLFINSKDLKGMYVTLFRVVIHQYSGNPGEFDGRASPRDQTEEELNKILGQAKQLDKQIQDLEIKIPNLLLTNVPVWLNSTLKIASVEIQGGEIWRLNHTNTVLGEMVQGTLNKTTLLREMLRNSLTNLDSVKLNPSRELNFKGNLHLERAKINRLSIHSVNGKPFEPDSFLSVNKSSIQRMRGIKAKNVSVDWLALKAIGNKSVNDVILEDAVIRSPVRVNHLEVNNVNITDNATVNNIMAKDIVEKAVAYDTNEDFYKSHQFVAEGGKKSIPSNTLRLQNNTMITNLYVDMINRVDIKKLFASLFTKEANNVINGSLYFKKGLGVMSLASDKIQQPGKEPNDVEIISLHDLNINGTQQYDPIYPQHYNSNGQYQQTNDYDQYPQPSYANNQYIETHSDNIPYPSSFDPNNQYSPESNMLGYSPLQTRNMQLPPGYHPNSLSHFFVGVPRIRRNIRRNRNPTTIYRGKVKITGNLKVNKIVFINSSLQVGDSSFPTINLDHHYWTRSSPQVIPGPVHFRNKVTLHKGLQDPIINDKKLTQFLTIKSPFKSIVLEQIHIGGDLYTSGGYEESYPDSNNKKLTCKVLEVKHLKTNNMNGIPLDNLLRSDHIYSRDYKIFIENLNVMQDLDANRINEIDLKRKLDNAVLIDDDVKLEKATFSSVYAKSLVVDFINQYAAADFVESESWRQSRVIHLTGDLHLRQLNATLINNKSADFNLVVQRDKDAVIHGKKYFPYQVVVENKMHIKNINEKNLDQLMDELLTKSADHNVTGFYTIENADIKSLLDVEIINGIETSKFVYINQGQIKISSDLQFGSVHIEGDLTAKSLLNNCILPKLDAGGLVEFTDRSEWRVLKVKGDSNWPISVNGRLQQILDSGVTETDDQTITGQVVIDDLYVNSLITRSLNGKKMSFLFEDTLMKNEENQVISGKKHFTGTLKCDSINVKGDARFRSINDIDIADIDKKLVRRTVNDSTVDIPISGHKTFVSGFKAFSFHCKDGINGIPANVLAVDGYNGTLPPLITRSLLVLGPLQVDTINDLHIDSFINDCVYLQYPSSLPSDHRQLITGHIIIEGNVTFEAPVNTHHINNISVADLVFTKNGPGPVLIKGCKTFMENLDINTDVEVGNLNNKTLSRTYSESVKSYQNVTFNGSLVMMSNIELNTIHAQQYYVGSKELIYIHNSTLVP